MEAKAEPSEKTVEESLVEFAESIDSTQTSPTAENNLPESSSKRVIY
jgi:hypothetical protein